jgi:hypothetical protein
MKKLNPWFACCCLVIAMVNSSAFAQDDAKKELSEADRLIALVQKGIREGTDSVFRTENAIAMEEHQAFFELDDSSMKKIRVLSRNLIKKQMENLTDAACKEAARTMIQGVGLFSTFTVNEKDYTLDGEEDEVPALRLTISNNNQSFYIQGASANQTMSMQFFRVKEPTRLIANERYQRLLVGGNEKSIEEFEQFAAQRLRAGIQEFMHSISSMALGISEEQEEQFAEWLFGNVVVDVNQTVFRNAKTNLLKIEDLPDFLSDTQKAAWRIMRAELTLR